MDSQAQIAYPGAVGEGKSWLDDIRRYMYNHYVSKYSSALLDVLHVKYISESDRDVIFDQELYWNSDCSTYNEDKRIYIERAHLISQNIVCTNCKNKDWYLYVIDTDRYGVYLQNIEIKCKIGKFGDGYLLKVFLPLCLDCYGCIVGVNMTSWIYFYNKQKWLMQSLSMALGLSGIDLIPAEIARLYSHNVCVSDYQIADVGHWMPSLTNDGLPKELVDYRQAGGVWQELRQAVLRRDNYSCVDCGKEENLHIHHLTYINEGCELLDDLVTLCPSCHGKRPGKNQMSEIDSCQVALKLAKVL